MTEPTRETRIMVESTSANPSILVLNTSYLYRNKYGILKSIILILSLVIFLSILLFVKDSSLARYVFLLCVNFAHLYIVFLMTACCLFSLTTATLLVKISFDFVFHIMAFILYLIGGVWTSIDLQNDETYTKIIVASTLILSFVHLAHGILSYKTHIA